MKYRLKLISNKTRGYVINMINIEQLKFRSSDDRDYIRLLERAYKELQNENRCLKDKLNKQCVQEE